MVEYPRLELDPSVPLKPPRVGSLVLAPAPYVYREPAILVVRLYSTRSGANATWKSGEQVPPEALNSAAFEPVLRAVVQDFAWTPPDTKDCPSIIPSWTLGPRSVRQVGSGVINWIATVVQPLHDPVRERIKELDSLRIGLPWHRQGALQMWVCEEPPETAEVPIIPSSGSGNRWLYNHLFLGVEKFAYRGIDGVAVGIVKGGGSEGYVLSPDHPDEPIRLAKRWYLFRHPYPLRRYQVD